jgi:hypothetical protein
MADSGNFRDYLGEVRREVDGQMGEMRRYVRALQSTSAIVTPFTPLIVENTHQRIILAVEKFQDLETSWASKLQKLEDAEAAQRQWTPQLEQLTAATTALETARREGKMRAEAQVTADVNILATAAAEIATARREAEEGAEAKVAADVDALQKDVRLAKAESVAVSAQFRERVAAAEATANVRVMEAMRVKESLLDAESRADARASLKVAFFRRKAEMVEAEAGKKVAGLVTALLKRALKAESEAEMRVAAAMARLEARLLDVESRADARASWKVAHFRRRAEEAESSAERAEARAEARAAEKLAHLQRRLLEAESRADARALQKVVHFRRRAEKAESKAEAAAEARVTGQAAQLEGRLLEAETRADARASQKVAHFRRRMGEAESRADKAESSAGMKVAKIVTAFQARTMQAEEKGMETVARFAPCMSEVQTAEARIALLDEQVRQGEGRNSEVASLEDKLRRVREKTRQEFTVGFDRWKEDCQRIIATEHSQALQAEVDSLGKAVEEMEGSKSNHDRATAELAMGRQALEWEQGDLQERREELRVGQERLALQDTVLKLREREVEAEVSTTQRFEDALEASLGTVWQALGEVTNGQWEVSEQLEEDSTVGRHLFGDLERKLDISIGLGEAAHKEGETAVALVKHLTEMCEKSTLPSGKKRQIDEGLEQPPSKAIVIDGSAARPHIVQVGVGHQTGESAEEGLGQSPSRTVVIDGSAARARIVQADVGCQTGEPVAKSQEEDEAELGEREASDHQEVRADQVEPSLREGYCGQEEEVSDGDSSADITLGVICEQIQLPQGWGDDEKGKFRRGVLEPKFQKYPGEKMVEELNKATYGTRSSTHDVHTCFVRMGERGGSKVTGEEVERRDSCSWHVSRPGYCVYLVRPDIERSRAKPYPSAPPDGRARWVIAERS